MFSINSEIQGHAYNVIRNFEFPTKTNLQGYIIRASLKNQRLLETTCSSSKIMIVVIRLQFHQKITIFRIDVVFAQVKSVYRLRPCGCYCCVGLSRHISGQTSLHNSMSLTVFHFRNSSEYYDDFMNNSEVSYRPTTTRVFIPIKLELHQKINIFWIQRVVFFSYHLRPCKLSCVWTLSTHHWPHCLANGSRIQVHNDT